MNVFRIEMKSAVRPLLVWSGITAILLILFMAMYPSMRQSSMLDLVGAKLDALPKEMLEAFGISEISDFSDIMQYFCYVFQYIVLAGGIYAAMLGAETLVREESTGTIEFLYAQPVTRIGIFAQKALAAAVCFICFIISQAICTSVLFAVFKPESADYLTLLTQLKAVWAGMLLSGLVFIAAGMLLSTLLRSAGQASPAAFGIVFGTFILGIISKVAKGNVDVAKYLKYFSPLDYGMPADVYKHGFDKVSVALGLGLIVLCTGLALAKYRKKDFRV